MTDPLLTHIDYAAFVEDVRTLATALADDGWAPDFLVGVGRGGLVPATYLSHATGIPLLSIDHSAQVYGFGDQLLAELAVKTREGLQMLIVDDINDSGATIGHVRDAIENAGGRIDHTRMAVLIDNIASSERVDYRGRSIDRRVTHDWFVFPWEAMADPDAVLRDAATLSLRLAAG